METESCDLICLVSSLITLSVSTVCVCQPQALLCDRQNQHCCLPKCARETQRMTNERGTLINREGTHLSRIPNKLEEIAP